MVYYMVDVVGVAGAWFILTMLTLITQEYTFWDFFLLFITRQEIVCKSWSWQIAERCVWG